MIWLGVDGALAVLALLVLAAVLLVLYRAGRAVATKAGGLSTVVAEASQGFAVTSPAPTTGAPVLTTRKRPGSPRR